MILLTSNVGTDTIMKLCADPETRPESEVWWRPYAPICSRSLSRPLGRLIAVPYYPITDDAMRKIIELQLGRIRPGCKKTIAPSSPMTTPWSPPSPSAVPR